MTVDLPLPVEIVTHSALIAEAAKWLGRSGCAVVITDMSHGGSETPDAIGWRGKHSILVECKVSLSDFRADALKVFRRMPERGMGSKRYFCTPRGLIDVERLPAGWGLIEWDGRKMREAKKAEHNIETAAREELSILLSALRRVAKSAPAGVSVRCYSIETKNRASLGVADE